MNNVVLLGRLCVDPEIRYTQNDIAVTGFAVAVDRSYVKSGADRQADFIDIVAWRSTAEFICKYFRKGQMIAVQGSIQTRTYTDKDGNKRKAFEIVAEKVSFAGGKSGGGQKESAKMSGDAWEEICNDDDLPF